MCIVHCAYRILLVSVIFRCVVVRPPVRQRRAVTKDLMAIWSTLGKILMAFYWQPFIS
jgi:hypothetical protein